jgi:hypothetical protein
MKPTEIVLGTAASLFAVMPGLNSILSGAGSTPGDQKLFGGVSVAVGVAVLLMVSIFRETVQRSARKTIVLISTLLLVLGVTLIAAHAGILSAVVVEYRVDDPPAPPPRLFLFPLAPTGKLAGMIAAAGGRLAALNRYLPDAIEPALNEGSNPLRIALTKWLLLVTFGSISGCFSGALLLLALRQGASG